MPKLRSDDGSERQTEDSDGSEGQTENSDDDDSELQIEKIIALEAKPKS